MAKRDSYIPFSIKRGHNKYYIYLIYCLPEVFFALYDLQVRCTTADGSDGKLKVAVLRSKLIKGIHLNCIRRLCDVSRCHVERLCRILDDIFKLCAREACQKTGVCLSTVRCLTAIQLHDIIPDIKVNGNTHFHAVTVHVDIESLVLVGTSDNAVVVDCDVDNWSSQNNVRGGNWAAIERISSGHFHNVQSSLINQRT